MSVQAVDREGVAGMLVLVEDQEDVRRALVRLLARQGWNVEAAANAAEARALLSDRRPRCVVLDYMLPDGTGIDVLRWLRERGSDATVIMYSAAEDDAAVGRASQLGAAAWVTKGGDAAPLFDALRRLCSPTPGGTRPA